MKTEDIQFSEWWCMRHRLEWEILQLEPGDSRNPNVRRIECRVPIYEGDLIIVGPDGFAYPAGVSMWSGIERFLREHLVRSA